MSKTVDKVEMTQIADIAKGFRKGMLGDRPAKQWCVAVSCSLAGFLKFCGYSCEIINGSIGYCQHCWIALGSGLILDPTADQFRNPSGEFMPKVYIGEKPDWYIEDGGLK